MLIECLILKGDFDHAETFAQLTLDSLKDPANKLDQLSEAVAKGYFNLGNAISHREVDIVKAENLLRESLRIRTLVHGLDHFYVGQSVSSLALILTSQEKLGDETREFYERALAINIKYCGPDGLNTVRSTTNLGHYYHNLANIQESIETRNELLRLSRIKFIEVLRIYTKIFGPDDPKTIDTSHNISIISNDLIKVT
jgi:tetratricopeptide (TPR) repeat protein